MRALIAIALFVSFTCSVYSKEQPIDKAGERQDKTKAEERGTDNSPLTIKILPAPGAAEKAAQEEEHRKEKAHEDSLLAGSTVWLALVTTALAVFTAFLWNATVKLVREAKKTGTMQLRAYVSSRPDFIYDFSPKKIASMRYTIENHGQTPAYSVQHVAIVDILPFPLPSDFQFPTLSPFTPASLTLHPRENIFGNVSAQRLFTAKEISDAAANNGCRIYCFGIINYESFGSIRTTKFCRSIIGSGNLLAVGSGGTKEKVHLDYDITSQHNEAS